MAATRIKYAELKRRYDLDGPQKTVSHLREALDERHLAPDSFSLRELFEALVPDGREAVRMLDPRQDGNTINLLEANSAVDTSAFSNITGQIVYSAVLQAAQNPMFIGDSLCTTIQTRFNGERIPGIGQIGDKAETVDEGQPYPFVGLNEDYIDTPATTKRGMIVPVTKEAVFFDRTNLVLTRAADVGKWLGLNKEKRIISVVTGITNNYKWKGTTYNTYQTTTPWINDKTSSALVDWTDIEILLLLFDAITDPNTSEPIIVVPNTLVVPSALLITAQRILNAPQMRFGDGASNTTQYEMKNVLAGRYNIVSSPYVKSVSTDADNYYFGDPKQAFAYMENWPITVVQAPPNSDAEFNRDIIAQYKCSERGVAAVVEPRAMCRASA